MSSGISILRRCVAFAVIMLAIAGCQKTEETKIQADVQSGKVLARVDGDPVFEGDILRRIRVSRGIADPSGVDPNQWQKMTAAALEAEIVDRLLLQAATREGMAADSKGVDQLLERSRTMMGEEGFREMLKKRNSTEEEYRRFLEKRSLIKQYREKLAAGITVDEDALRRTYEGNEQSFVTPEKVRLEVLVIKDPEDADDIYQKVTAGEDFAEAARDYSLKGKEVSLKRTEFMRFDELPRDIELKVRAGSAGDIIGPVTIAREVNIYKLLDRQPSRVLTYEEAMEGSRDMFLKRRQQEILDEWAASAKQKARIEYIR